MSRTFQKGKMFVRLKKKKYRVSCKNSTIPTYYSTYYKNILYLKQETDY